MPKISNVIDSITGARFSVRLLVGLVLGTMVSCGGEPSSSASSSDGSTEDTIAVADSSQWADTAADSAADIPTDTQPEDTADVPPAHSPNLVVTVDGVETPGGQSIELPLIEPGLDAYIALEIHIRNTGTADLEITKAGLAPFNEDGTNKSMWVVMDWDEAGSEPEFPHLIHPTGGACGLLGELVFNIVYTPKTLDPKDATLRIVSNDPTTPVFVLRFAGPPLAPRMRVEPPNHTFDLATLTMAEIQTFELHNDGLLPLFIEGVSLIGASEHFQLLDAPEPGLFVKAAGSPGSAPLSFTVSYKPSFGSGPETALVHVLSNDPTQNPVVVHLTSNFETGPDTSPCLFAYETENLGGLYFGDSLGGKLTMIVSGENAGTGQCVVTGVDIPSDPSGYWYSWDVAFLPAGLDGPAIPTSFPITFGPDEMMAVKVTYDAPGFAVQGTMNIDYEDPKPAQRVIPLLGGGPEPCIDIAPGSLAKPETLHFNGPGFVNIVGDLVIYNCSDGKLGLTHAILTDAANPGGSSQYWNLLTPIFGYTTVAPRGIRTLTVSLYVADTSPTHQGVLELGYVGVDGPQTVTVSLDGIISENTTLPLANPGGIDDYPNLVAAAPLTLDGSKSDGNGVSLDPNGYLWFLTAKPAESALILNGPPGPATRVVTPDVAGVYTFGLVVRTQGGATLYSKQATVTVTVVDPPEAEPEP